MLLLLLLLDFVGLVSVNQPCLPLGLGSQPAVAQGHYGQLPGRLHQPQRPALGETDTAS